MIPLATAQNTGTPVLSRPQADAFSKKVDTIVAQAAARQGTPGSKRTTVTEGEVNSWFAFRAQPLLPAGMTEPSVSALGNNRVSGRAIVDLDAVSKRKSTGGTLDPWSFIGGKVPLTVTGTLQTMNGVAKFDLESAQVSAVPVPKFLLQELLTFYSRSPKNPDGVSLDDSFQLPANIRQIDIGQGQAVVIQ